MIPAPSSSGNRDRNRDAPPRRFRRNDASPRSWARSIRPTLSLEPSRWPTRRSRFLPEPPTGRRRARAVRRWRSRETGVDGSFLPQNLHEKILRLFRADERDLLDCPPFQLGVGFRARDLDELFHGVVDEERLEHLLFHFTVPLAAIEPEERGNRFLSGNPEVVDRRPADLRRLGLVRRHLRDPLVVAGDEEPMENLLLRFERALLLEELPQSLLGSFGAQELDGGTAELIGLASIASDSEKMLFISSDHECLEHLLFRVLRRLALIELPQLRGGVHRAEKLDGTPPELGVGLVLGEVQKPLLVARDHEALEDRRPRFGGREISVEIREKREPAIAPVDSEIADRLALQLGIAFSPRHSREDGVRFLRLALRENEERPFLQAGGLLTDEKLLEDGDRRFLVRLHEPVERHELQVLVVGRNVQGAPGRPAADLRRESLGVVAPGALWIPALERRDELEGPLRVGNLRVGVGLPEEPRVGEGLVLGGELESLNRLLPAPAVERLPASLVSLVGLGRLEGRESNHKPQRRERRKIRHGCSSPVQNFFTVEPRTRSLKSMSRSSMRLFRPSRASSDSGP